MRFLSGHDASQFDDSINFMNNDNHGEQRIENREDGLIYF
jgi:hypothetical protein